MSLSDDFAPTPAPAPPAGHNLLAGKVVHGGTPVQRRDGRRVRGQRSLKADCSVGERACGVARDSFFHPAAGNDSGIFLDLPAQSRAKPAQNAA
jgi:hypothetical protein